jgi:hypothetical protein
MENVLGIFASLIRTQLEFRVYTTKESIRYTFLAAILGGTSLGPQDIIFEWPHPEARRAKIDMLIPSRDGKPVAIAFKYDRAYPGGVATSRAQNAGMLFRDIFRLAGFARPRNTERFLIFCTAATMVRYFRNPANGHTTFFDLPKRERIAIDARYLAGKPATFRKALEAERIVELECRWAESLPMEHELRIYIVRPHGLRPGQPILPRNTHRREGRVLVWRRPELLDQEAGNQEHRS